jgi:hypothetical protein
MFVEAMVLAKPDALRSVDIQRGQPPLIEFFKAQMQYLLLWTPIERFVSLRWGFGGGVEERLRRFARNEESFRRALLEVVEPDRHGQRVHRADRPGDSPERLDLSDPVKAIGYYYQVRSNVAHRGKSAYQEDTLLRRSLDELWRIFIRVLDEALGEARVSA